MHPSRPLRRHPGRTVLCVCLAALVAGCAAPLASERWPAGPVADAAAIDSLEESGIAAVNAARRAHGRRALAVDAVLTEIARPHAADMLLRRYFDHISPEGSDPGDRVPASLQPAFVWVAENLWRGRFSEMPGIHATTRRMVEDWLASPEHREAMLREGATEMGLGMARDDHTVVAVLLLARGR